MTDVLEWEYPDICKSVPFKYLHHSLKTDGVIELLDTGKSYFPYCTKGDKLPIENCKNLNNAGKSYIFCMISLT